MILSLNEIFKRTNKNVSSFDPIDLLGYTFVHDTENLKQWVKITDVNDAEDKITVLLPIGSEEQLNCIDFINFFNASEEDGHKLWTFDKIIDHQKNKENWEKE